MIFRYKDSVKKRLSEEKENIFSFMSVSFLYKRAEKPNLFGFFKKVAPNIHLRELIVRRANNLLPSKLIRRWGIIFALGRKSTKILQKWWKGQLFLVMTGLKRWFVLDFWRFLFFCRNVKKNSSLRVLRLAWKSANALLAANMRVLKHYPQLTDNEIFRKRKPFSDFLFKSSEL